MTVARFAIRPPRDRGRSALFNYLKGEMRAGTISGFSPLGYEGEHCMIVAVDLYCATAVADDVAMRWDSRAL